MNSRVNDHSQHSGKFGMQQLSVLERPPSIKNSTGISSRINNRTYRSNTVGKIGSSLNERLIKNAPLPRNNKPIGKKIKFLLLPHMAVPIHVRSSESQSINNPNENDVTAQNWSPQPYSLSHPLNILRSQINPRENLIPNKTTKEGKGFQNTKGKIERQYVQPYDQPHDAIFQQILPVRFASL